MKSKAILLILSFLISTMTPVFAHADINAYKKCKRETLKNHLELMIGVVLLGSKGVRGFIENVKAAQKCDALLTEDELKKVLEKEGKFRALYYCPRGPLCSEKPGYSKRI